MLGGHYTYAQVPLGFWMEGGFGFARNHYDRIGHFAQGFIPAMLAREIFIRRSPLAGSRWLPFLVVCFCLAFSALYELIEFWTALCRRGGDGFPGDAGRLWDTQWDMQLALIGAIVSLVILSRAQDRQLAADGSSSPSPRRPLNLVDATRSRRSPSAALCQSARTLAGPAWRARRRRPKRVQPTALLVPNGGRVCRVRRFRGPVSAGRGHFGPVDDMGPCLACGYPRQGLPGPAPPNYSLAVQTRTLARERPDMT